MDYSKLIDLGTRAGWTGLQAALSLLIVDVADVKVWWAAPLALTLSAAKTWVVNRNKPAL
jgi:hypothetical protein